MVGQTKNVWALMVLNNFESILQIVFCRNQKHCHSIFSWIIRLILELHGSDSWLRRTERDRASKKR